VRQGGPRERHNDGGGACNPSERVAVEWLHAGAILGESRTRHNSDVRRAATTGDNSKILFPEPTLDGDDGSGDNCALRRLPDDYNARRVLSRILEQLSPAWRGIQGRSSMPLGLGFRSFFI
jgi:hypothetical protein